MARAHAAVLALPIFLGILPSLVEPFSPLPTIYAPSTPIEAMVRQSGIPYRSSKQPHDAFKSYHLHAAGILSSDLLIFFGF